MVRLLGKIAEKQISAGHDTIVRTGQVRLGTGGVGSGATYGLNTGFNSVISAWFTHNMKVTPGVNATLGGSSPIFIYKSDTPTYGATVIVAFSTVGIGYATVDWFAIGDI